MLVILFFDLLVSAVLYFCGASDISEIPSQEYERYEALSRHPLPLNSCSRARMMETGLFTAYQVESLLDYRERCGPVLSQRELSLVDGFNAELAGHLMPFVSLGNDPSSANGGIRHGEDICAGGSVKIADAALQWHAMGKASAYVESRAGTFTASAAYKKGNSAGYSASYSYGRTLRKLVAGHFNARFAQGLSQWSGVSFDSWTTAASLMHRASGITPYSGWSTQYPMLGLAATLDFASISLSPFADIRGGKYGANLSWNHPDGQVGATLCCSKAADLSFSADFQHTLRGGVVLFGEGLATFNPVTRFPPDYALLSGVRFRSGASDMALRLKGRPDQLEMSFATGIADASLRRNLSMALDAAFHPRAHAHTPKGASRVRASLSYAHTARSGFVAESHLGMKLQFLTRLSDVSAPYAASWPLMRFEARQKAGWKLERWEAMLRADAVFSGKIQTGGQSRDIAFLAAAEGAWKGRIVRCHAQAAVFRIDSWDSRIYLYQRDAPGMFSVPAMYGRGISLAGYAKMKFGRRTELHLKCAWSTYPWAREGDTRKRDSLEANIQISYCPAAAR